jgi:hypothetical protein
MVDFPRLEPERTCFTCKFYRPDDVVPNTGVCIRHAPSGNDNWVGMSLPEDSFCPLPSPIISWCGEWERWTGTARTWIPIPPG